MRKVKKKKLLSNKDLQAPKINEKDAKCYKK